MTKLLARIPRPLVHAGYVGAVSGLQAVIDALTTWHPSDATYAAVIAAGVALLRAAESALTNVTPLED